MKTHILLLASAYLNSGAYVDAGVTVAVSNDKTGITEERAKEIVRQRRASEVDVDEEGDGLDKHTVAELKKLAEDEKIDLGTATTKPLILAVIRAHRQAGGEG